MIHALFRQHIETNKARHVKFINKQKPSAPV